MDNILKTRFKFGELEFETEGSSEDVKQQLDNFTNTLLPIIVQVMEQIKPSLEKKMSLEKTSKAMNFNNEAQATNDVEERKSDVDYSRTSLASFLKQYGQLNHLDFTLFAAYFYEKKTNVRCFTSDDIKKFYQEVCRSPYSNIGVLLKELLKKGLIMDAATPEDADEGKYYMLTHEGLSYIENYVPKDLSNDKKRPQQKKDRSESVSKYSMIKAEELNLNAYPSLKDLSLGKDRVVMIMYILTNENKGEWFTVSDVVDLFTNVFEISATKDMVSGVIKRNRKWFNSKQDDNNKKASQYKLLAEAKDYAKSLISK